MGFYQPSEGDNPCQKSTKINYLRHSKKERVVHEEHQKFLHHCPY